MAAFPPLVLSPKSVEVPRQKSLGAFYTPEAMATKMVEWAIRSPDDLVMDPSFGGLVFLEAAQRRLAQLGAPAPDERLFGADLDDEAHRAASEHPGLSIAAASLVEGDFFALEPGGALPHVHAVVGNPPYVRSQLSAESGEAGRAVAKRAGVSLSRMVSLWAPFTVHATDFVAPGGRLALVLPAELLHAQYSVDILNHVQDRFARTALVIFEERVFPGALEEVVLLFADGRGEGVCDHLELVECHTLEDLDVPALQRELDKRRKPAPSSRSRNRKLMGELLQPATRELIETVAASHALATPLGSLASVDIGAVTGANSYFLLADAEYPELARDLLKPAISKAMHVRGATFERSDWERLLEGGTKCQMFVGRQDSPSTELETIGAYLADGERQGIPDRYKCRVRSPWWSVPLPRHGAPDLFLTYFASEHPRMVLNAAAALHTNTVHGVSVRADVEPAGLAASFFNSLSLLSAELVGRSYGGGVLKLEPSEAERVLIPTLPADAGESLPDVDELVRAGDLTALLDYVDGWLLIDGLGLSATDVAKLRAGGERLRSRRRTRGKSSL